MQKAAWQGRARYAATFVLLLVSVLPTRAWAQSVNEGSIEGTVSDPSSAVIAGAIVRARLLNTSAVFSSTSNEHGIFRFLVLPAGTYEISAGSSGFATLVHNGVVVTVGAKIHLPLTLALQSQADTLKVTGETPLVETTSTNVSATVGERLIKSLPVNGRDFVDFVVLAPGAIRGPGGNMIFGGQRSLSLVLMDGTSNNNPIGGEAFRNIPYQFSLEAVQEFQVNSNSYSAELGRAANGVVSTITKSGSNEFHGALFWYYRDRGLNSTDVISKNSGAPKEPLHVNQFGAAVGGPIVKNRLFFFTGYDGQRRQRRNLTTLNLPSGFALSSNATVAAFQQQALNYLTPRAASYIQTFNEDPVFAKVDWNISPAHRLSTHWNSVYYRNAKGQTSGRQNSPEHTGDTTINNRSFGIAVTSVVSTSAVNAARFGYLYNENQAGSDSVNPQANIFESGQLVFTIGRAVNAPFSNEFHQFEVSDTLSISHGRHAVRIGGNILVSRNLLAQSVSFSGNYRFNSLESFGRSLTGAPLPQAGETYIQAFSGLGVPGVEVHPNSLEFAAFVQDEWHIFSGLTLSLGLRYDAQVIERPRVGNATLLAAGWDLTFAPRDWNNVAPRLGFAWSPPGNQRLVIRGGYGMFYVWLRGGVAGRAHVQNGVSVQTRTFTPGTLSGAFIPAYPNTVCGPPDPSGLTPTCAAPTSANDVIMLMSPDYVQPYDQHASLGAEYQFHRDWAISGSYLLVRGSHLQRWRDLNLPTPVPSSIAIAATSSMLSFQRFTGPQGAPVRPIAGFGRILAMEAAGNSTYHGLAVQAKKRLSQNFQFQAAYTLGKVLDDRPEPLVFNPGEAAEVLLLTDPSNARADRGPGAVDARHRFVANGVWELDYGRRLHRSLRAIFGGWELSGILSVQSGFPYSGLVNFDLNNDGNPFSDRTPGQSRNTFRQSTTVSFDPRVTRSFRLGEQWRAQFIWEAFNIFNSANVTDVRATEYSRSTSVPVCGIAGTPCLVPQNTGANAFGSALATSGPRIMQLSVKMLF